MRSPSFASRTVSADSCFKWGISCSRDGPPIWRTSLLGRSSLLSAPKFVGSVVRDVSLYEGGAGDKTADMSVPGDATTARCGIDDLKRSPTDAVPDCARLQWPD